MCRNTQRKSRVPAHDWLLVFYYLVFSAFFPVLFLSFFYLILTFFLLFLLIQSVPGQLIQEAAAEGYIAGGKSGLAVLFGPTGGYLAGFVVMAWCAGMGGRRREGGRMTVVVAAAWALAGLAVAYGLGALRLIALVGL